jgi:hypothetical protein
LFLIINTTDNINVFKILVFIHKARAAKKEIFDMKSKKGIITAGKTNKLDKV